jgi:hypothetical protein
MGMRGVNTAWLACTRKRAPSRVCYFRKRPWPGPLYANSLKGSLAKLSLKSSTVRAWKRSRSDIIPRH